jgi:hypothetical protein
MSSFAAWIRSFSTRGRGSIVAAVTMMVVLGCATGAALAQDKGNENAAENSQAAQSSTTTSDLTTSNADPTTSTSDPTTTTSDDKTTTSDDEGTTSTSEELVGPTDSTTTTSDTLNTLAVDPRVEPRATTCEKIDPVTASQTATVTVGNPNDVTLTFTFNDAGEGEASSATWSSSAPFTGDIIVKAGNEQSGGGEITYSYVNATTGTVSSPFTNQNGQTLGISHVEICGERGDTTTPPTTTTTTTTTAPPTTTATTVPGTTGGGGVAGTTGAGGGGGGAAGQTAAGGDQPAVAQAAEAAPAESGLAFTGLYAPLMVLVALAMGTAGFALRKRINGSA